MQIQRLSESIAHIEDLPVDEFIGVLQNMSKMIAQEKLDGANLWVGLDTAGKFFTSREGKRSNSDRRYSAASWPKVSAFNQFRAAHAALELVQDQIKHVMRPGDMVEAEVLFGRQPNSVTYGANGKSYIAFLRGVNGTPDIIAEQLATTLNNQAVEAEVDLVESTDGRDLESVSTRIPFQFTTPQQIDPSKLTTSGVTPELTKLEAFLRAKSSVQGYTNNELATALLTSFPKELRAEVKLAREEVLAKIQTDFKLPIKAALLDTIIRQLQSHLTDRERSSDEDTGIEGIVLRDPATGKQVKIVDKDIFGTINKFNQSVRGEIQGALNTVDPDASLEARGGLVGELRIQIAEFLGNRELAKAANVRKILEPIKGATPEDAIRNFAKSMPGNNDPEGAKHKILAMIADTARQLDAKLTEFKKNKEQYRLKLKNGKELGLSDETVKKTLVSFAEARRNMTELFDKIKTAKTMAQILAVLYGSAAKAVHQKDLTEELLTEKKGEIDSSEYDNKTLFELLNSYFATVFMAMVIYHTNDIIGLRRLRDRKNYLMKHHAVDMSPLNHWGFILWRNNKPEAKKHLSKKVAATLHDITKNIPAPWWKFMHMHFSYDKGLTVTWAEHKKTLLRLMELSGVRSERLNKLLDMAVHFDRLSYDDQVHGLKKLIAFARRFVPRSSLYLRMRVIEDKLKVTKEKMVTESLLKSITAITEDDAGGAAAGAAAAPAPDGGAGSGTSMGVAVGTTAGAIASLPMRIGNNKRTELRRRNPEVKNLIKKFKDPRKQKENK